MGKNKTNIIVIDKTESNIKSYDDNLSVDNIDKKQYSGNSDANENDDVSVNDGGNDGNNNNKKTNKTIIFTIAISLITILFFTLLMKKPKSEEPKLYSELYKNVQDGSIKLGDRQTDLLEKDVDLWVDTYGSTTYLISYNDLIMSNIYFISDTFKNQFEVLANLDLYYRIHYSFVGSDEFIDLLIKKLNEKNYFTNYIKVKDFKDANTIYLINKDRITLVKEVIEKFTDIPYIEVELPNGTICKTRTEYRDNLRDYFDNNDQFAKDLEEIKTILNENKNDVLNGVILYDDPKHSMLYLYKKHSEIIQTLKSIFNDKQKEEFIGEIGKFAGELINIDDKIIVNPSLIKSIKYDGSYVSINLDGGYNSFIEKINISSEAKNELDEYAKENNIEILDGSKDATLTEEDSKVVAMYTDYLDYSKEIVGQDHIKNFDYTYEQLKEVLEAHKDDVLNAVVIDKDNYIDKILYFFKNSDCKVKPLMVSFGTGEKMMFFWEIEKTMGDILILDDKVLLNPRLIREVIYNPPYTTIYVDGGLNSILKNLKLSQDAIKKLKEWQKLNNQHY